MLNSLALAGSVAHVGGHGAFWLAPLFFLLWLAPIIVLIVVLARSRRRFAGAAWHAAAHDGGRGAEKTLAERFANGDIDEVEYRARLEVLRANRPTPPVA